MDNFRELQNRYASGTATVEEEEAYLAMVASGNYDLSDDPELDAIWYSQTEETGLYSDDVAFTERIWSHVCQRIHQRDIPTVRPDPWWAMAEHWRMAACVAAIVVAAALWQSPTQVPPGLSFEITAKPAATGRADDTLVNDLRDPSFFRLPDGSTVLLNAGSRLSYSDDLNAHYRQVELVGEGLFDVTHDPRHPFRVKADNVFVTVLGTEFSIDARDRGEVTVEVTQGRVNVSNDSRIFGTLSAGRKMVVNTSSMSYYEHAFDPDAAGFWRNCFLNLQHATFGEVLNYIRRQFHVEIEVADPSLNKCEINVALDLSQNVPDILSILCAAMNAKLVVKDNRFQIYGGGCAEPPSSFGYNDYMVHPPR